MNFGDMARRAGRLLVEAGTAAGSAVGAAYAANPGMDGSQAGTVAASAAAIYIIGALRRSFLPQFGGTPPNPQ